MARVNVIDELRDVQRRDGWVTDRGLAELSRRIDRPVHELYGVASFYPEFHLAAPPRVRLQVCTALPCQMRGSELLVRKLEERAAGRGDVRVVRSPCLGACDMAPVAAVNERLETCDRGRTIADLIVDADAVIDGGRTPGGMPGAVSVGATATVTTAPANHAFAAAIEPTDRRFRTDPYASPAERWGAIRKLAAAGDGPGGFGGVVKLIKDAELRGMGGAGKPASRKWEQVAGQTSDEKFVVCNADESEPGTLKDREILKTIPHLVVEAMVIAGLTVGATRGYVYLRHEYHEQQVALLKAIGEARAAGVIGDDVAGTGRAFRLDVFVSPGGYILGEATALLEALEGKRGQPRNQIVDLGLKDGVPSYNGLWGKPTVVNNVETYCYVPAIVMRGADWFRDQGVNGSHGLKWGSVCGDVVRPGVFEVPMGTRYRDLIEMAGGVTGGWAQLKAFAPSGPTYGFRPPADVDETMDFHAPPKVAVGSGAVIVLDRSRCMVDAALNFTRFFRNESCGKCVPCRAGSAQMVNLIKQARDGKPRSPTLMDDVDRLEDLMVRGSICGLGQVVGTPFQSVRKHWPAEVEAHLSGGRCVAGVCGAGRR